VNYSYTTTVDHVNEDHWSNLLRMFDDANLYQTPAYGRHFRGGDNLSYIIIKKNEKVVSMCMVRILKIPFIKGGVAYAFFGPLFRGKRHKINPQLLNFMLKMMYEEYVMKRKLLLRIVPNFYSETLNNDEQIFKSSGFHPVKLQQKKQTVLLDLKFSLDELSSHLSRNWRRHLIRSQNYDLKISEGTGLEKFDIFMKIYNEMILRKKLKHPLDSSTFRCIQKELPNWQKMRIMIGSDNSGPVAGIIVSALGNTGIYIMGATNTRGLKTDCSYLLQWKMIEWLKSQGYRWYDLGGIDKKNNPGVYQFKSGLRGIEITYAKQFEAWRYNLRLTMIRFGDLLRRKFSLL